VLSHHWYHHARFYVAIAIALAVYAVARILALPVPPAIAADTFFGVYLGGALILATRLTPQELDKRADVEDEGILLILLITLAAIAYAVVGVFAALNDKGAREIASLALTLAGAPLGWLMLHTVMTFHYANIFYLGSARDREKDKAIAFPGGSEEPGVVDFLYFSFVIGMTAQVSDVQVQTTRMRRAVMVHGIVSFFFNTVLIAMAVNAVVARAG
jgi:uncharacterized membrane protein